MSLKTKNLILLSLTGLGIFFILINLFLPLQRGEKISPLVSLPPLPPSQWKAGEEVVVSSSPAPPPASLEETSWRNPFIFPSNVKPEDEQISKEENSQGKVFKDLRVTAILKRGNTALATINHQVVREGDLIEEGKVISIEKDSVTLLLPDGSKKILKLYENLPLIKITNPRKGGE